MDTNKDYFLFATTVETGEFRGIYFFTLFIDENYLCVYNITE